MVASEGAFESTAPRPSREHRAAIVLALSGLFALALTLLFGGVAIGERPLAWGILLAGPLVGALTMLAASLGLNAREPWATSVVTPLLLVLLIADLINAAFALTHSSIPIPLVSVLVIWALRAPSEPGWAAEPADGLESSPSPYVPRAGAARWAGSRSSDCSSRQTSGRSRRWSPFSRAARWWRVNWIWTSALTLDADCVPGGPPPASIDINFSWAWNWAGAVAERPRFRRVDLEHGPGGRKPLLAVHPRSDPCAGRRDRRVRSVHR